jgi:hypothetical protein
MLAPTPALTWRRPADPKVRPADYAIVETASVAQPHFQGAPMATTVAPIVQATNAARAIRDLKFMLSSSPLLRGPEGHSSKGKSDGSRSTTGRPLPKFLHQILLNSLMTAAPSHMSDRRFGQ